MIAVVEAYRAGRFDRRHWPHNIVAGVIVGVVALPLAMAFAIASGAKPEQGLYTAIVAGLAVSLFGGSRVQIAGPTGAFIVILAGITATHGIVGLQIATLMAGVILIVLGAARLGELIKYIPDPVIAGFTAGIGVIIWVGQWKDFFGLPPVEGTHFHEKLPALVQALPSSHGATTALGVAALLLIVFAPRAPALRRVPGPLVALVATTLAQAVFHFDGVATIGSAFGGIPAGLPTFQWPDVTAARIVDLVGPAFAIAALGAIESLLSAVVADGMAGTRHDSNQELIGQGIANVAAPLFGGFAATGAIARTATNIRNGGNSPLAGIVHCVTLVLTILLLAPLAVHVPLATLAAILFVVAWNMSEPRRVARMIRRAPPADGVILSVTFLLTVFVDLVVAVNIGVAIAALHFLRRMAASVEVSEASAEELRSHVGDRAADELAPGVRVLTVNGPFFFGAVDALERAFARVEAGTTTLVVHFRWVPFMDITGLHALEDAIRDAQRRGIEVILAGANERVQAKLARAGIVELVGRERCFADLAQALRALAQGVPVPAST